MIVICTPTRQSPNHDYNASLVKLTEWARAHGLELAHLPNVGCADIYLSRNVVVAKALAAGAEHIVFIDDDIGWEPQDFAKLFIGAPKKQIVAGAFLTRRLDARRWNAKLDSDALDPDGHATGICGTAFMRIDARVFAKIDAEPFENDMLTETENAVLRNWFNGKRQTELNPRTNKWEWRGEDWGFCTAAREAGIEVYIDPSVNIRHWTYAPLVGRMIDDERIAWKRETKNDEETQRETAEIH